MRQPFSQLTAAGARGAGRRVAMLLSLLGMLLAGAAACTSSDSDDPPSATEGGTPTPTAFTTPPDGGELKVVEVGFSVVASDGPSTEVSFGVIIENTSSVVAHNSFVSIWLVDADGERLDGPVDGAPAVHQALARLLPGDRVGIGATQPIDGDVADVEVEITPPAEWLSPDRENWLHQPVIAQEVTVERGTATTVEFTVDAAYTSEMVPGGLGPYGDYVAIFRDAAGRLVGGADCCVEPNGIDVIDPGQSRATLSLDHDIPERADGTKTEVYVLFG